MTLEEQFIEFLSKNPKHWFSEINAGVRVMDQIAYALYQAFCSTYGYEMGEIDLAPKKDRIIGYSEVKRVPVPEELKVLFPNHTWKSDPEPIYSMWGHHPDDWKILKPIFIKEKEKYLKENVQSFKR